MLEEVQSNFNLINSFLIEGANADMYVGKKASESP